MAAAVTLHTWNRQDRHAMEGWPQSSEPFAWLWAYSPELPAIERSSWGIESAGELVGRVTLRGLADPTLGIYLRPDRLGRGIGRAALALFLDLVFGALARQSVGLHVAVANQRAVRCYQSLGFMVAESQWYKIPNQPLLELHRSLPPEYVTSLLLGPPPMALYWSMRITALEWEEHKERTYAPAHALSGRSATGAGA